MNIAGLKRWAVLGCGWILTLGNTWAKLTPEQAAKLPGARVEAVDFVRDVKPILEASCIKCHGRGKSKGGFRLDTRESFLQPGDSGPAVAVGKSGESYLIELVSGLNEDSVMPQKGARLTAEQVSILRGWIDQGLKWGEGVTFAKPPANNLRPRKPSPPGGPGAHPVDAFLGEYLRGKGRSGEIPVVDDATFARRVSLDLTGLLPTAEELEVYRADPDGERRVNLVRRLLGEDPNKYAQHWMSFWNDLLRNDYRGTGYIDGGREQISKWLYRVLRDNLPYDRMVDELVMGGTPEVRGFIKGIVWRGTVNASQLPPIQAAQNVGQVFLGVNLKCASCHDSFIDDWQLSDAYALAGVFAETQLDMVQCDRPLGKHAPARFLFPELGSIDDQAPRPARQQQLARILTSRENGRLTRTIVNRIWAKFLGRGLVEPLDVMQNVAWSPDILDWLAEDFAESGFDLRHLMEVITTSRAYQMPSIPSAEKEGAEYVFRGPVTRRLSAEQFRDALGQIAGVWFEKPEGGLETIVGGLGGGEALAVAPYWIWNDAHAAEKAPAQTVYFRRRVELKEAPNEAALYLHADDAYRVWINGQEVKKGSLKDSSEPVVMDARAFFKPGVNVVAVEAGNTGETPSPAGLLVYLHLRVSKTGAAEEVHDVGTDAAWKVSSAKEDGWQKVDFADASWRGASVLGTPGMAPWNLGRRFEMLAGSRPVYGKVRSSLVAADPLAIALGRPNREQVNTTRASIATTLQALELTNGKSLAAILKKGAEQIAAEKKDSLMIVEEVFVRALGRKPNAREARLGLEAIGDEPKAEGVEDFLWAMAMLPEFQLIR